MIKLDTKHIVKHESSIYAWLKEVEKVRQCMLLTRRSWNQVIVHVLNSSYNNRVGINSRPKDQGSGDRGLAGTVSTNSWNYIHFSALINSVLHSTAYHHQSWPAAL